MKTLRTLFTWSLLLCATQMMAKIYPLSVAPVSIGDDGTGEIVVNIDYDTSETVCGWNFSLYLPEGVNLNFSGSEGKLTLNQKKECFTLSESIYPKVLNNDVEVDPRFYLDVLLKTDGGRLVVWIDSENKFPLKSTHGELIRLKVKAASNFTSGTGEIKSIGLTNSNNQSLELGNIGDVEFDINHSLQGVQGDVNGDKVVDVADVACINSVMSGTGWWSNADVNGDYTVDVADISTVYGIMAAIASPNGNSNGKVVLTADPITIAKGETVALNIKIDYTSSQQVTGWNFSLYLPAGVTVTDYSADKSFYGISGNVKNYLIMKQKNDGGYLLTYYSDDNTPIPDTHGTIVTLTLKATADVQGTGYIKGIALSSSAGESLELGNIADSEFAINGSTPPVPSTDNYLYMSNTEVKAGAEETLSIQMKNTAAIRGFQFNLYLPDGVTAVKSAKGKIQASLSAGRLASDDEHTLNVTEQQDGSLLFLCGSQYDETFTGNDGEVLTLKVKVAESMADGDYPIIMKNIKLSETNINNYYEMAEVKATLTVSSYIPGDINRDQKIDVSDYIGVANRILGIQQAIFIEKAGDVDENGVIDVSDYIGVANIILTGNVYGTAASRSMKANTDLSAKDNVLYVEPFTAEKGGQVQLSLKMKNTAPIRGFQFNLVLPEGVTVAKSAKGKILASLSAGRLPDEDEHTLAAQEQADGSVLFLCGSQYDECFTGNDGEIATVTLNIAEDITDGNYAVLLKNIKLTETDISKYYETEEVETTLTIGNSGPNPDEHHNGEKWGDVNNDGEVDVADIATIIDIMAASARQQVEMEE